MPFKGSTGGGGASASAKATSSSQNKSGIPPPDLYCAFPCDDLRDAAIFYFTADAGDYNANKPLVDAMELIARKTRPPDCIIQGGDNFYPNAGTTKDEVASDFHSWRARWLWGALENVKHYIVQGNHDSPTSHPNPHMLNFTDSPENPNGLWCCRGDDPNEPPSSKFTFSLPVYGRTSELEEDIAIAKKQAQQEKKKKERILEDEKRKEEEIKAAMNGDDDDDNNDEKTKLPSSPAASSPGNSRQTSNINNDDDEDEDKNKDQSEHQQQQQNSSPATTTTTTTFHPKTGSKLAGRVHFTIFDTNAVSGSVLRRNPELAKQWPSDCEWLYTKLAEQEKDNALFRIVCNHFPCYAVGQGHYLQSMQLHAKLNKAVSFNNVQKAGLGFENILVRSGVDAYLAGHEHVLHMTERDGGVIHAVAGGGAEWEIYGGKVRGQQSVHSFDWEGPMFKRGFLVGCITADLESARKTVTMTLSFISVDKPVGGVMYTKSVTKPLPK